MDTYFGYLDNAGIKRNYDWFALNINLNFNKEEIDFDKILNGEQQMGTSENEIIFIHEYLHFIQNFGTSWGGMIFCKFTHGLYLMGVSKITDGLTFKLPFRLNVIEGAENWNSGIESIEYVKTQLENPDERAQLETTINYPNYNVIKSEENTLILSNGRILFTVGNKTIREHMAHIGSMLFANKTDEGIHNDYVSRRGFCSTIGVLDKEPEYWILFEYFFHHGYKNIAEGIFLLCNESLATSIPTNAVVRFFNFLTDHNFVEKNKKDLVNIVYAYRAGIAEAIAFTHTLHSVVKIFSNELVLCSKHSDHDFYKFNTQIFLKMYNQIYHTYSSRRWFDNPAELRKKDFWHNFIKNVGTPIVRYKDKKPIITAQNKEFTNSLIYFLGVVKTIDQLQSNTNCNCPFHTEFNICEAKHKNSELCLTDPHLVKNPLENGEECLFQNALELMGLNDRIINE